MPRTTASLIVSEEQIKQIEQWLAALGTPQQVEVRCRIILALGRGIERIPHTYRYRLTDFGLRAALFFTRRYDHLAASRPWNSNVTAFEV
jgi:hypothetical protein